MSKLEIKYNKEEPQSYEAYVYEYHIGETNKKYLGYHVGRFDETYQHSCENPQFLKDLSVSKKITITLIDFGSKFDMINLEHELLKSVDAKNNPNYYNRSNGGGRGVTSVFDIDDLYQKIINKAFPIRRTLVSELKEMIRLQVRLEDDSKHTKAITDRINADHGNTDNYLVHVLEEYDNGKDAVGNGNHSIDGADDAKNHKTAELPTMYIPKSEWSKYNKSQLRLLCLDLNPKLKYPSKPNVTEDIGKWLYNAKLEDPNFDIHSKKVREELKKEPRYLTPNHIKAAITFAEEMLLEHQANLAGKKMKKYEDNELEDIQNKYTNPNRLAFTISSGNYKDIIVKVIEHCMICKSQKKKDILILIYHNSYDRYKKWPNILQKHLQDEIDFLKEVTDISLEIEILPQWVSDTQ
jgi:hypothetical protein